MSSKEGVEKESSTLSKNSAANGCMWTASHLVTLFLWKKFKRRLGVTQSQLRVLYGLSYISN
jgi:hypothetical protein